MRLERQLAILEAARPIVNNKYEFSERNGFWEARGKAILTEALAQLQKLPYFETEISNFLRDPMFIVSGDLLITPRPELVSAVGNRLNQLAQTINMMIQALKSATPAFDQNAVAVMMPCDVTTVDEAGKILQQIARIFSEVVLPLGGDAKVSFSGFDTGSAWFIVSLAIGASVQAVRVLAYAAAKYAQERVRHAQAEAYMATLNLQTEYLKGVQGAIQVSIEALARAEAETLAREIKGADPAKISALTAAIRDLGDLFYRGLAIEPAKLDPIETPTFPNVAAMLEEAKPKLLSPVGSESGVAPPKKT